MVPLLERVAWLLCHRVQRQVNPQTLLRGDLDQASALCRDAIALLKEWETAYLATREAIEANGRDARWEFDRKRLFQRTGYLVSILGDLLNIATITKEFYNIFGHELKSVTGNPEVHHSGGDLPSQGTHEWGLA
jgi:dynein heavy chain